MIAYRQLPPSEKESSVANASRQRLSRYAHEDAPLTIKVLDNDYQDEPIELPAGAVKLLLDILEVMSQGKGLTLIPENAELTTVQSADILNVSRPFLVKLLENGEIPFRKVGKHRRIRIEDVMDYKNNIDRKRSETLDQLVADAQENGMGYD